MKFYYSENSESKGPFTLEELKKENVNEKTLVWYEGIENWTPLNEIDQLKSIIKIKDDASNNTFEEEKIILKTKAVYINGFIPDNPFLGSRETGMNGTFTITNKRIHFKTNKHLIFRNLMKEEVTLDINEITCAIEKNLYFILPFFIEFQLKNGAKYKFSFGFKRKPILDVINNLIFENQIDI